MRLQVMFFDRARDEFLALGLEGKYLGVDVEGDWDAQKAFFIHETDSGVKRTEWRGGAGSWEGACHSMHALTSDL